MPDSERMPAAEDLASAVVLVAADAVVEPAEVAVAAVAAVVAVAVAAGAVAVVVPVAPAVAAGADLSTDNSLPSAIGAVADGSNRPIQAR
jgi:hypothetical protein